MPQDRHFAYIEIFFNRIRCHPSLAYVAPLELERRELTSLEVAGAELVPVHQNGRVPISCDCRCWTAVVLKTG